MRTYQCDNFRNWNSFEPCELEEPEIEEIEPKEIEREGEGEIERGEHRAVRRCSSFVLSKFLRFNPKTYEWFN